MCFKFAILLSSQYICNDLHWIWNIDIMYICWNYWKKYTEVNTKKKFLYVWCIYAVCCPLILQLSTDSTCYSCRCSTTRKSWWNVPGWKRTSSARPLGLSWPVSTTMRSRCLLSSSSVPCLKGWYSPLGLVNAGVLWELINASVKVFFYFISRA